MKNITGAVNHMNLQKILALMALYLWTHGAKKGAMVHVPPTQGTQGTQGICKAKGIQGIASELPLEIGTGNATSGLKRTDME